MVWSPIPILSIISYMKPFVQTGGYGFNRAKINSNKQYNTAKEMFTQIVANMIFYK